MFFESHDQADEENCHRMDGTAYIANVVNRSSTDSQKHVSDNDLSSSPIIVCVRWSGIPHHLRIIGSKVSCEQVVIDVGGSISHTKQLGQTMEPLPRGYIGGCAEVVLKTRLLPYQAPSVFLPKCPRLRLLRPHPRTTTGIQPCTLQRRTRPRRLSNPARRSRTPRPGEVVDKLTPDGVSLRVGRVDTGSLRVIAVVGIDCVPIANDHVLHYDIASVDVKQRARKSAGVVECGLVGRHHAHDL